MQGLQKFHELSANTALQPTPRTPAAFGNRAQRRG
jgi:hypothetical protein